VIRFCHVVSAGVSKRGDVTRAASEAARLKVENIMYCTSKLAIAGLGFVLLAGSFAANAAEPASSAARNSSATRSLDLKPPLITSIFTAQQIEMILANTVDLELERVEVEAARISDLSFQDNSASLGEVAFREVVRWVSPYPAALTAHANPVPDFTDSYRPVPLEMSWYHASFRAPFDQQERSSARSRR
jgi:hypothetical protein